MADRLSEEVVRDTDGRIAGIRQPHDHLLTQRELDHLIQGYIAAAVTETTNNVVAGVAELVAREAYRLGVQAGVDIAEKVLRRSTDRDIRSDP